MQTWVILALDTRIQFNMINYALSILCVILVLDTRIQFNMINHALSILYVILVLDTRIQFNMISFFSGPSGQARE